MTTRLGVLVILLPLCGCATAIPMTSKMSETVMMGIKQGPVKAVAYEYMSIVQDGEIQPVGKDSREVQPMSPTYVHTESETLNKMIKDYVQIKFGTADPSAPAKIKVVLKDFWLEQYNTTSAGKQFLVAVVGGEMNIAIIAHLNVVFEYLNGGVPVTKTVKIEADSTHVQGIGTYSNTSAYHRGRDSMEFRVAEAINGANNKAIAMLNIFLDSAQ